MLAQYREPSHLTLPGMFPGSDLFCVQPADLTGSRSARSSKPPSKTRSTPAAVANGLVADAGQRQGWATIRSGLSAGLREPIDLDDDRPVAQKRRRAKWQAGEMRCA